MAVIIPLRVWNISAGQNVSIEDALNEHIPTTAILFLFLLQPGAGGPHPRHSKADCVWCVDLPTAEAAPREAKYEEQELSRRFNGLVTALRDFSRTYNSRRVIDAKKIKAIRKEWHEIEKSDWFCRKHESRELR